MHEGSQDAHSQRSGAPEIRYRTARAARWWALAWPPIISLSALAAALAVVLDWPAPLRPALTTWFVVIGPGMALIRPLRLGSILAETMLAIALSLALAGIVATALVYAGAWSPEVVLSVLIVVAIAGLAVEGRR